MDCASAGRDDKLCLFVTREETAGPTRKFLEKKTGLNAAAFAVLTVPEIPRNDAGKILYGEIETHMGEISLWEAAAKICWNWDHIRLAERKSTRG